MFRSRPNSNVGGVCRRNAAAMRCGAIRMRSVALPLPRGPHQLKWSRDPGCRIFSVRARVPRIGARRPAARHSKKNRQEIPQVRKTPDGVSARTKFPERVPWIALTETLTESSLLGRYSY